jgi:NADH-quinone oxidoreductase subunit I
MLLNIIKKMARVTKAVREPRQAILDSRKDVAHVTPMFRGRHKIRYDICTGCSACEKICPVDAIIMADLPVKRPKALPEVNLGVCIFCGLCEDVCPTKPDKAIKLSGGTFDMVVEGLDSVIKDYWITSGVTDEWIDTKKKEEEEKARKKAEMLAKKKAETEATKNTETEEKTEQGGEQ